MAPNIALIGRARTGKDTAAAILGRKRGYRRLAFADPLRDIAYDLDPIVGLESARSGFTFPERYSAVLERFGYEFSKDSYGEVRRTLQRLGVAVRDHLGEDVWVRALESRIEATHPSIPLVVTDVRFPNEVDALRDRGFVLVRLTRLTASTPGANATHVSETALDDVRADFTFANDGTVEDLEAFLDLVNLASSRMALEVYP
jgi:hypothetical protein